MLYVDCECSCVFVCDKYSSSSSSYMFVRLFVPRPGCVCEVFVFLMSEKRKLSVALYSLCRTSSSRRRTTFEQICLNYSSEINNILYTLTDAHSIAALYNNIFLINIKFILNSTLVYTQLHPSRKLMANSWGTSLLTTAGVAALRALCFRHQRAIIETWSSTFGRGAF